MKWYFIILIIVSIIFILFMFLVLPGNKKEVWNYDWLYKNAIAHRGYHSATLSIVENTKTAFDRAIRKGYNIETDISLTKDLKIIVFHDDDFNRICNVDKKVSDLTLDEIKQLKLIDSNDEIMEFSEFLSFINSQTGLLIEFKSQGKERNIILVEEAMKQLKTYKGNYVVQSFDPNLVRMFKKKYPFVPRGQLYTKFDLKEKNKNGNVFTKWMYNNKLTNFVSRPLFIDHQCETYDGMCRFLKKFMKVIVWTVKDDQMYDRLISKVDNIIFENLELDSDGKRKSK